MLNTFDKNAFQEVHFKVDDLVGICSCIQMFTCGGAYTTTDSVHIPQASDARHQRLAAS